MSLNSVAAHQAFGLGTHRPMRRDRWQRDPVGPSITVNRRLYDIVVLQR